MRRTVHPVATTAALGVLLVLGACSGLDSSNVTAVEPTVRPAADSSASSLLKAARKVLASREGIRVKGTSKVDGDDVAIDVSYQGDDATGTMRFSTGSFRFVVVGKKLAVRANSAFWTANGSAEVARRYAGRWVAAKEFDDLVSVVSRKAFLDDVLKPEGKLTRGKDRTLRGVACFTLVDSTKDGRTLLLLDRRDAAPVRFVESRSSDVVTVTYDHIGVPIMPSKVVRIG